MVDYEKNENGPPYYWITEECPTNVRTPASNIIWGGLAGLAAPARALGNSPNRIDVWKILFEVSMVGTIDTIDRLTNVKL